MKVFYSRVSSTDGSQSPDRQLQNVDGFDYVFTDKCSGSIDLYNRPYGSQIKKLIDDGQLTHLEVHSFDRLGRNTLDILNVYRELTESGITVVSRNPNIRNLDEQGKPDPFSELLLNLLASLSNYEKSLIRERQMEGIALRKAKKLYRGRVIGTQDTPEKFIQKKRSQQILKYLNDDYKHYEIIKIIGCSPSTIQKVKRVNQQLSQHQSPHQ
jgi:DNA invertase Pin-like site-specific DNA recombinase